MSFKYEEYSTDKIVLKMRTLSYMPEEDIRRIIPWGRGRQTIYQKIKKTLQNKTNLEKLIEIFNIRAFWVKIIH